MLVVGCEDAWVDDCSPGNLEPLVNRLGAENSGGPDFIGPFACLVEHECEHILVVRDGDAVFVSCVVDISAIVPIHLHALKHELTLAYDGSAPSAVVGVLPSNATVLLVNTNNVRHLQRLTLVVVEYRTEVLDGTQAVTAEFLESLGQLY